MSLCIEMRIQTSISAGPVYISLPSLYLFSFVLSFFHLLVNWLVHPLVHSLDSGIFILFHLLFNLLISLSLNNLFIQWIISFVLLCVQVHRLYESGYYEDVVQLLMPTLHQPQPKTKVWSLTVYVVFSRALSSLLGFTLRSYWLLVMVQFLWLALAILLILPGFATLLWNPL